MNFVKNSVGSQKNITDPDRVIDSHSIISQQSQPDIVHSLFTHTQCVHSSRFTATYDLPPNRDQIQSLNLSNKIDERTSAVYDNYLPGAQELLCYLFLLNLKTSLNFYKGIPLDRVSSTKPRFSTK